MHNDRRGSSGFMTAVISNGVLAGLENLTCSDLAHGHTLLENSRP